MLEQTFTQHLPAAATVVTKEEDLHRFFATAHPNVVIPSVREGSQQDAYEAFLLWTEQIHGLAEDSLHDPDGGEFESIHMKPAADGTVTVSYRIDNPVTEELDNDDDELYITATGKVAAHFEPGYEDEAPVLVFYPTHLRCKRLGS